MDWLLWVIRTVIIVVGIIMVIMVLKRQKEGIYQQGISSVYGKFESSLKDLRMLDNEAHAQVLNAYRVFAEKVNRDVMNCRTGEILKRVFKEGK